jgi:hypothetical protein
VDRICFQLAYTFKEDFEKQIGYDVYKYGLIYESVVRWWLIDKKQQVIFADIPILAVMGPAENSMTCSAHGISYVNFSWSNSSGKYFIKD